MPAWDRRRLPEKIMSVVLLPRRLRMDCSPRAQRMASAMFDLPEPFGPTIAVTPVGKTNSDRLANDLYPCSSSRLSRIVWMEYTAPTGPCQCDVHTPQTGTWKQGMGERLCRSPIH